MTDLPFIVQNLDHVVVAVRDMKAALGFYRDVLGLRVERRIKSIGLVQLRAGANLVDLITIAEGAPSGRNMDHFALRLEPFRPKDLRAHLRAHGIKPGKVERRYGAQGDGPSMYIQDPDGNTVELKGPPTSR
ncbi:MAG: VOC family protein [Alphaproteobacteria bacterium]|jgi:catechol 2,3-dioxygenase-like lactoylglutathione lyase family enzyme|nr:VOC family protein [Alphaproteobacteria bacterium]HJP23393.1 VOC family protein [Alphaproteobacteria bacterium]